MLSDMGACSSITQSQKGAAAAPQLPRPEKQVAEAASLSMATSALLALPNETIQLVLWKCPVRELVRLARSCKQIIDLAKITASQMLSGTCASATTRAAAAAGVLAPVSDSS